jgi:hypothetical protein
MKTQARIAVALLIVLLPGALTAQISKKAQVGFRFLENPISAEVIGRGGAGVTSTLNASGVFWNPALLAWNGSRFDVSLHRTQGIADINYSAIAASADLWGFGVLGISYLSMDYGDFYGTRISSNAAGYEETGTFSPKAYALGIAFAQRISDRFSYGVHVKIASQDLGSAWVGPFGGSINDPNLAISERKYDHADFALDVGACYDFLYNGIRFGASLQNISREIKYENEAFPMPFAVNFGISVQPLQFFLDGDISKSLLVLIESRHPRDFDEKLKFGAEYTFMQQFVARLGYMKNYDERGITAGIGLRQDVSGVPLRFDYAYEAFGIFGARHHFSLGVSY